MKQVLTLLFLNISVLSLAQTGYYTAPMEIPLVLSAGFAELRSNHFHSGIDIKTQGTTGLPVFSVADGFVSRIVVSPGGFGNALYIDHYNGTTSVYGHLQEFRKDIQDYVRKIQYRQQSFKIDVQVSPELFLVEKGEMIAKSGNSGSSGGPHLHFEIRDTKTEEPLNPLQFGFEIADKTPPRISGLKISQLSPDGSGNFAGNNKKYDVIFRVGKYQTENNQVIPISGPVGFAVEVFDYFDLSNNRCGINSMTLKMDGEVHFQIDLNRFSFSQTKYINSYTDYAERIANRRWFQKTWIEPGNKLDNYVIENDRGVIEITDENIHRIEIEAKDSYGNSSVFTFSVRKASTKNQFLRDKTVTRFVFDNDNHYETEGFRIDVPAGALYTSIGFEHETFAATQPAFSEIHQVGDKRIPLHKSARVSIKTEPVKQSIQDKILLAVMDDETGNLWSVGGKYDNGWLTAEIPVFGWFVVSADTISPKIIPLSIHNKNSLVENNRIRFIIRDDLSGIKSYRGSIDGKWALFEYDAKNDLLVHYFDLERFELHGNLHQLRLEVTDYKQNKAVYESTFRK